MSDGKEGVGAGRGEVQLNIRCARALRDYLKREAATVGMNLNAYIIMRLMPDEMSFPDHRTDELHELWILSGRGLSIEQQNRAAELIRKRAAELRKTKKGTT